MLYNYESDYNNLSLKEYAENKIRMLENEFKIKLSHKDIEHMYELPSKMQVDAFCRTLFTTRL